METTATHTIGGTTTVTDDTVYAYDALGRLSSVSAFVVGGAVYATHDSTMAVTSGSLLVTTYAYDAVGNRVGETLPNGDATTYAYDDLNRLTDLSNKQEMKRGRR